MMTIRIGFIGAGAIARSRHLPGLKDLPEVEVAAVSNRTRASSEAVAREFGIAQVVDNWRSLVEMPELDAVFIGTWPYMHREMSVAALGAGKHVFCQARMAMDLAEARAMLDAARARPELVSQVCPPPTRMPFEPFVRDLLARGELGEIVSVELVSRSGANLNPNAIHWRERKEFSGNHVLALGIYAETLNAWVGPYEQLAAHAATPLASKRDASAKAVAIQVPQIVTISGRLASGALCVEHHLGLAADSTTPGDTLTLWGRKGTLRYTFGETIEVAPAGGPLRAVDVPDSLKRGWRVEADFIASVQSAMAGTPSRVGINPDFAEGLAYMRKVEAVHVSAATGRAVKLSEL
jgi:predicted dehydrogenase